MRVLSRAANLGKLSHYLPHVMLIALLLGGVLLFTQVRTARNTFSSIGSSLIEGYPLPESQPTTAFAPTPACEYAWRTVQSPDYRRSSHSYGDINHLMDIAVIAPDDIWAVGISNVRPMIQHWDGSKWDIVPNPLFNWDVEDEYGILSGVAAVSTDDVWAVGHRGHRVLLEHWNGTDWNVFPAPATGEYAGLEAVAAISSDDIWAVGYADRKTLTMHWDGNEWSVIPSPNITSNHDRLNAVAAISTDNVWAVGQGMNLGPTLIMRWDGTKWSIIDSPEAGTLRGNLLGIAAVTANDIWAVGYRHSIPGPPTISERTLIMHWDGSRWSVTPSPNGERENMLRTVVAVSAGDIWAAGGYWVGKDGYQMLMHWDGTQWSIVPGSSGFTPGIDGLAVTANGYVWAVGAVDYEKKTFVARYSNHCEGTNPTLVGDSTATPTVPWSPTVVDTGTPSPNVATGTATPIATPTSTYTPTGKSMNSPTATSTTTITETPTNTSTSTPSSTVQAKPTDTPTSLPPTPLTPIPTEILLPTVTLPATPGPQSLSFVQDLTFIDVLHGWLLGSACEEVGKCRPVMRATTDGGSTWHELSVPAGKLGGTEKAGTAQLIEHVRFANDKEGWVYGEGFFSTRDGGKTWLDESRDGEIIALEPKDESVWAIERTCRDEKCVNTLLTLDTKSGTWDTLASQPEMMDATQLVRTSARDAWIASWGDIERGEQPKLAATHDGGRTWRNLPVPCMGYPGKRVAALGAGQVWYLCVGQPSAGAQPKTLYVSQDGGENWRLVAASDSTNKQGLRNLPFGGYAQEIVANAVDHAWIFYQLHGLEGTSDGGHTWSKAELDGDVDAKAKGPIVFVDPLRGWVPTEDRIFRTSDGGATWERVAVNSP